MENNNITSTRSLKIPLKINSSNYLNKRCNSTIDARIDEFPSKSPSFLVFTQFTVEDSWTQDQKCREKVGQDFEQVLFLHLAITWKNGVNGLNGSCKVRGVIWVKKNKRRISFTDQR